jgi:hypothetical protein
MLVLAQTTTGPALLHVGTPAVGVSLRTSAPSMKMTRKERKRQQNAALGGAEGVVVPTAYTAYNSGAFPDQDLPGVETSVETSVETKSKLPPITGSTQAFTAEVLASTKWNPNNLDVALMPKSVQAQFVPEYLKTPPTYLDGTMAGDVGFDPWGLVALANPTMATDKVSAQNRTQDEQA